jgi:hypothetical protein
MNAAVERKVFRWLHLILSIPILGDLWPNSRLKRCSQEVSEMLAAPKRLGRIFASRRIPRVVFGVSPNRVFPRDAPAAAGRGLVRAPELDCQLQEV